MSKTAVELRAFAEEHLLYEIDMVFGLVRRLVRQDALFRVWDGEMTPVMAEVIDLAGRNADIESFGLHMRNALDFLYDHRGKPDDSIASDYFDTPVESKRARPTKPRILQDVKARVGVEIVHLSYLRSAPSKEWPYPKMWDALTLVLRWFTEQASAERVGEQVLDRLREIVETPIMDPHQIARHMTTFAQATTWTPLVVSATPSPGTATTNPTLLPLPEISE